MTDMETYLLTIYVTLEKEKAIKELFALHGWIFKTACAIGNFLDEPLIYIRTHILKAINRVKEEFYIY